MAITSPTIVTNGSGGVTIEAVGMTYEAFLASLGSNVFRILELYMTASSIAQLLEQIKYNIKDATGIAFQQILNYAVDPYQKIPAYRIDLSDDNVILNGQSNITFNLLPGESLMLQLICDQKSVTDKLDVINPEVANTLPKDEDQPVNVLIVPTNPREPVVHYEVQPIETVLQQPVEVRKPELKLAGKLKKKISASIVKKQMKTF